jgi:alkylhydroperoxidase family enzyme
MQKKIRDTLVSRILDGVGVLPQGDRKAAFANDGVPQTARPFVAKVATQAARISDEDVAAAKAAGLSEDAIFELAVCAAIGQSTRQYESALAALAEATKGHA